MNNVQEMESLEERLYNFRVNSASAALGVHSDSEAYLLNVYAEQRRVGDGSLLMEVVCEFADYHKLTVFLIVQAYGDPHKSVPNDILEAFYQRFGFRRDPLVTRRPYRMVRHPSQDLHGS